MDKSPGIREFLHKSGNGVNMVGTGEPIGQSGIFSNDLGTMLDPNQPIYRLSKKIPRSIPIEAF